MVLSRFRSSTISLSYIHFFSILGLELLDERYFVLLAVGFSVLEGCMSEERIHGGVRYLTKRDIEDAEVVYIPPSEKRYKELVDRFLINLARREDEQRKNCVGESEERKECAL